VLRRRAVGEQQDAGLRLAAPAQRLLLAGSGQAGRVGERQAEEAQTAKAQPFAAGVAVAEAAGVRAG